MSEELAAKQLEIALEIVKMSKDDNDLKTNLNNFKTALNSVRTSEGFCNLTATQLEAELTAKKALVKELPGQIRALNDLHAYMASIEPGWQSVGH